MNKFLLMILLGLLSLNAVLASTPQYTILYDIPSALSGNNLGRIIITPSIPLTTQINKSDFTNIGLQQHDTLHWNGNNSIVLTQDNNFLATLTPNSDYVFSSTGEYFFYQNGNPSFNGTISVLAVTKPTIALSTTSLLGINFSQNNFLLNNESIITLSSDNNINTIPQSYNITFFISSQYKNENHTRTVIIQEIKSWSVSNTTLPTTVSVRAGDAIPIGNIKIDNTGNVGFDVVSIVYGEGKSFVQLQEKQSLFKGTNTFFSVLLQVPQRQNDGEYNATIVLSGGNTTVEFSLVIIIKDTIPPVIQRVTFKDNYVFHNNEILVEATDNINISTIILQYYDINISMKKDQQLFSTNFTAMNLTEYAFTICAVDTSNNSNCTITKKTFLKLNITPHENTIKLSSKKHGSFGSTTLFNLTEDSPEKITITLTNFNTDLSINESIKKYSFRIVTGDGQYLLLDGLNTSVKVKNHGSILFEVKGENISNYDGIIEVTTPEILESIGNISFKGKHLEYDVPERFTKNWYGNKTIHCDVIDTNDLETSYYSCITQFPISLKIDELAIPTTPNEKSLSEQQLNQTIIDYQQRLTKRHIVIGSLFAFLLLMFLFLIYAVAVHPNLRFRIDGGK